MSGMVLTQELVDLLTEDPENKQAFVQEEGRCYAKYDEIRIVAPSKDEIEIQFHWKRKHISSINSECSLSSREILTLLGVEGRIEIKINAN